MKQRVIIFGGSGFVGSHIAKALDTQAFDVVSITRKDCDFADSNDRDKIRQLVQDGDIVVCAAAKAPAKDLDMLVDNVALITNITEAIRDKKLAYVLNVSSDAVFADSMEPIDESFEIAPLNAHGIMHCMREQILGHRLDAPLGHIRPTLIYGEADPHNGYGPNSYIRLAQKGEDITLFGEGEERRDHIHVGDVAKIAVSMIEQKTVGAVNAVTATVTSFMDIAKAVQAASDNAIEIKSRPRSGPMPHDGYRAFDNSKAKQVCSGIVFKDITSYIQETLKNAPVQLTKSA